ncbi:MAG: YvcK family protein, partial [Chloroflexi bacterium]|nr:YvcK family protein [Chloroflexota bacterium]
LEPAHPMAYPEAAKAIYEADMVVVGPGSLYTSVLPNLLVDGIQRALVSSDAIKVYVSNVATERGETDGFGVREHLATLLAHLESNPFDYVLANDNFSQSIPSEWRVSAVSANDLSGVPGAERSRLIQADLVDPYTPLRHEPGKLAAALMKLHEEKVEAPTSDTPDSVSMPVP